MNNTKKTIIIVLSILAFFIVAIQWDKLHREHKAQKEREAYRALTRAYLEPVFDKYHCNYYCGGCYEDYSDPTVTIVEERISSDDFSELSDSAKYSLLEELSLLDSLNINGKTIEFPPTVHTGYGTDRFGFVGYHKEWKYYSYDGKVTGYDSKDNYITLRKNPETGLIVKEKDDYSASSSFSSNSSTTSKVCAFCHGSGKVRYYYGSSWIEAALSGHDNYEYGKCTSCNGTGKVN